MNNLIAKVAELRELAAKDIPGKYTSDCPEYDYMVGVLNAAPGLLAALGKVQAGDMLMIENIISCMKTLSMDEYGEYTNSYDNEIAFLRRYADLARLLEDDHAT